MEHRVGELLLEAVDALPSQHQIETPDRGIVAAERGTRLDRNDDDAVVDQLDLNDMRSRGDRGRRRRLVAALEAVG
jgi:hypothetical protein